MSEHSDDIRIYGEPDPDNSAPPPEQGLRGEQGTPKPIRSDLGHTVMTAAGKPLDVEEQSGTAFAEATERADGTDPGDAAPGEGEEGAEAAAMEETQKEAAEERKEGGYQ